MSIIIPIFLIATSVWLIYWALIRTSLLDSIQNDYEAMQSQAEWAIIKGLPASQSQAAMQLLAELEHHEAVRWISISQAIFARVFRASEMTSTIAKDKELFDESPKWIRDLRQKDMRLAMKAALVNSPIWWIPLAVVLLASLFSMTVANWWNDIGGTASRLRTCTPTA